MGERYEVQLSTPGAPKAYLTSELSIGKFGQTLNLDHPDISHKHCSFFLSDGILSLKDHSSDKGTFINGDRIPAEQPIIVTLDDEIKLASILIKLALAGKAKEAPPPLPDVPPEPTLAAEPRAVPVQDAPSLSRDGKTEILDGESLITEINAESGFKTSKDEDTIVDETVQIRSFDKEELEKVASQDSSEIKHFSKEKGISYFLRLGALLVDFNLTILFTQLLVEYDQISFLAMVIEPLSSLLGGFIGSWVKSFTPYLVVFLFTLLLSNLLFKRSLGQLLIRISVEGEGIAAHGKALLRTLVGLIVWPFVVFDFPAFFSRPTVKEALCGSRFFTKSSVVSFSLACLVLPLSFVFAFLISFFERGPLESFKSFEYKTIIFSGKGGAQGYQISRFFDFEKPKKSKTFLEYPSFELLKKKKKQFFVPSIQIYYPKEKLRANFKSSPKKIDLKKMLSYALRLNPLAFLRFSEVIKFVEGEPYNNIRFYEEFKNLTKASLELRMETMVEHLLTYGPFFKSFFDYRDSFEGSLDKPIEHIRFVKIGDRQFMKVSYVKGKFATNHLLEETLIPMERLRKPMLSFQFESEEILPEVKILDFYRQYFSGVEWSEETRPVILTAKTGAYDIVDYFSQKGVSFQDSRNEHAFVFRFFYKLGRILVRSKRQALKDDFLKKLKGFLKMIIALNQKERRKMDELRESSLEEATFDRLIKKVNEMMVAFENEDLAFFRLKTSPAQPMQVPGPRQESP